MTFFSSSLPQSLLKRRRIKGWKGSNENNCLNENTKYWRLLPHASLLTQKYFPHNLQNFNSLDQPSKECIQYQAVPQKHSQVFSEKFLWIKITGLPLSFFFSYGLLWEYYEWCKKYAVWLCNTGIRYSRFPKHSDHGSLLLLNLTEQYSKENCFGKKC